MMKKNIILFFFSLYVVHVAAQDPNWSVDATKYQYNMTFTAFLNVNGTTLSSTEDKVAAFINNEVRGVANVTYVASVKKYLVYLTVHANTNSETISFKIYTSANQSTVEAVQTHQFSIDGNVGGVFQSYSIANPALSDKAILNSFSFSGITSVEQSIQGNEINIVLPANTDVTNLKAVFDVSEGARFYVDKKEQVSGVTTQNFTDPNKITYTLLSENQATLKEYEVTVTKEEVATNPPRIELTTEAAMFVKQAPVLINLKSNVDITGFTAENASLTNAVISSIEKQSNSFYKLELVPIQQGAFSIEIPENKVFNNDNEGNLASNKLSFVYDLVKPYVVSIKRNNPLNEITESNTLQFTVVFSEDVKNVSSTAFQSVSEAIFNVIKQTDSKYMVNVTGVDDFIGAVSLHIKASNTIQDKAGNLLLNSVFNAYQNE